MASLLPSTMIMSSSAWIFPKTAGVAMSKSVKLSILAMPNRLRMEGHRSEFLVNSNLNS